MTKREKRQKASDVFAANPPLLGTTTSISKAFPEIKSVKMIVEEQDGGHAVHTYHFSLGNLPGEYLDCRNPRCYNGGYAVGRTLRYLTATRETHHEDYRSCQGFEGSPKGRKRSGPCDHSFKVTVDLEFHPQDKQ